MLPPNCEELCPGLCWFAVWMPVLRPCQTFLQWDLGLGLVPHPIGEALGFGKSQRAEIGEAVKGKTRVSVTQGLGK